MPNKQIAVVGGGYTGLTAAYYLAKAGHKVTVFERATELGGLAAGFEIDGTNLEKTYHHIFHTDIDIIDLASELGISDKLRWHDSSLALFYKGTLYPFMTAIDLLRFRPLYIWNRIRAGLVVLFLQKWTKWRPFTKVTALGWMRRWAGKQVVEVIWEPLLRGKFSKFYDQVAMAWLWARIHIRANSRLPGERNEKLGYFKGGFINIVNSLRQKLDELGVEFVFGAQISAVDSGRLKVADKWQSFDRILLTVPSSIAANLVEHLDLPDYVAQLRSINYLGAVVGVFTSKESLSKYYWHNINDVQSPFLVFIQHTNLVPAAEYGDEHVYYIGTYLPHDHKYWDMQDGEIWSEWWNYLKKIFPGFTPNQVNQEFLFKLKNAQHIVDTDYVANIPDHKTPISGVYLANFAQIFPEDRGTNFAVRDGKKIARLILSEIEQ